jgi:hypothetical protein
MTIWRYWVRKKIVPKRAKKASAIAPLAAEKRRLRNSRTSSIGVRVRSSQATKPARSDAASAKPARMTGLVQPRSGASMIAATSAPRPRAESRKPPTSSRGASGSRDSGTRKRPAASATATIGRLTRNTRLQSPCSTSQPPVTGPMTMPRPLTAAQIPIALPRSCAGNTAVRMESVDGMMNAPPMPISARVRISMSDEPASAERADPSPNTTKPKVSAFLRPNRSPSAPAVSRAAAKTSM